jgi:hypothetical protein
MSIDLASQAAAVNEAIQTPAPQISNPKSLLVDLLRGLYDDSSLEWQTRATVRELTGADEEALAAYDMRNEVTYSEYMTHLLRRAVVSIGSVNIEGNPEVVDNLIIGDRDLLFLGIIKATYGRYREFEVTCRQCKGKNDITVDLDEDFKVKDNEKDLHSPLIVKLRDGSFVELNYPTGADSQHVSKKAKTTAEQNTLMLARCVINNDMSRSQNEAWAKGLNMADRNKLVKALLSAQPGPRMEEVETQCAHCSAKITLALDWVSLLFG